MYVHLRGGQSGTPGLDGFGPNLPSLPHALLHAPHLPLDLLPGIRRVFAQDPVYLAHLLLHASRRFCVPLAGGIGEGLGLLLRHRGAAGHLLLRKLQVGAATPEHILGVHHHAGHVRAHGLSLTLGSNGCPVGGNGEDQHCEYEQERRERRRWTRGSH